MILRLRFNYPTLLTDITYQTTGLYFRCPASNETFDFISHILWSPFLSLVFVISSVSSVGENSRLAMQWRNGSSGSKCRKFKRISRKVCGNRVGVGDGGGGAAYGRVNTGRPLASKNLETCYCAMDFREFYGCWFCISNWCTIPDNHINVTTNQPACCLFVSNSKVRNMLPSRNK